MSVPKKHHFLPQFYLKRFKISPQKGKLSHIYRIEKSLLAKITQPAIKDTGCKRDFNTIDFDGVDKDRQTIESNLSLLESNHDQLLTTIQNNLEITDFEKYDLINLIVLMRYRVPNFKKNVKQMLESTLKNTWQTLDQNGAFPEPPEVLKKELEEKGIDAIKFNISNWKILELMYYTAFKSRELNFLPRMKYELLIAPDKRFFITCDSPIALYHPDYDPQSAYGVGSAFNGCVITFPISEQLLVKASWDGVEGTRQINKKEADEYNRRIIVMADFEIFSPINTKKLISQVQKFHKTYAGFHSSSEWSENGSYVMTRFIPVIKWDGS